MSATDFELTALRSIEREIDLNNRIADFVVYDLQIEPELNNAALMRAYAKAIERFKSDLPPVKIRAIVDAVVVLEVRHRMRVAKGETNGITHHRAALDTSMRRSDRRRVPGGAVGAALYRPANSPPSR